MFVWIYFGEYRTHKVFNYFCTKSLKPRKKARKFSKFIFLRSTLCHLLFCTVINGDSTILHVFERLILKKMTKTCQNVSLTKISPIKVLALHQQYVYSLVFNCNPKKLLSYNTQDNKNGMFCS